MECWDTRGEDEFQSSRGLIKAGKWLLPFETGNRVYHHSGFASCVLTQGGGDWYHVPGPDGIDIIRQLSLREMLRLQGLPGDFELSGSLSQMRKQIGNAVPPPMVKWIVRCLQDQSSHTPTSDIHYTTDILSHFQRRYLSPDDKKRIDQQLKNLSKRKLQGKAQREAQEALEKESKKALQTSSSKGAKARHAIGGGQSLAKMTKRFKELDEQMKVLDKVMASLKDGAQAFDQATIRAGMT